MLPDFEMIVHKFPARPDITIYPIADVHLGARECMEQEFMAFLKRIEQEPGAFLILGGDLINNSTRSSVSNIFDETMRPSDQKRMMAKLLEPVKDKILCAVGGNHERRSGKDADDDPMYDILCKIDKEDIYRESMAFVKLQFGDQDGCGQANPTYMLVVCHGSGGGQLTSGAVLRAERMSYSIEGADAFIMGHTHRPFTTSPGKIFIDKHHNQVTVKPFKVINMTSWLEYGGYAMQKMLIPTSHSMQTLTLFGKHKEMKVTM